MRESAREKAKRILAEGRVIVVSARPGVVWAKVRGEGTIHNTGYGAGMWTCSCECRTVGCSHIAALKLISAPDIEDRR